MKIKNLSLIAFCLIFILSACKPVSEPSENHQISPISPLSPLPAPLEAVTTDETGAVRGIVMHSPEEQGEVAVSRQIMALAKMLKNTDGLAMAPRYAAGSDPYGITDEQGRFVMNQVPPGTYILIIDQVVELLFLSEPDDAETALMVEVVAGEVLDLGLLKYDELPLE